MVQNIYSSSHLSKITKKITLKAISFVHLGINKYKKKTKEKENLNLKIKHEYLT